MAFDLMKNKFCEKDLTMQTNLRVDNDRNIEIIS